MSLDNWKQIMEGEHTMHHNPCSSNGVSSDMFIESKYMRYGLQNIDANVTIQILISIKKSFQQEF